MEYNRNVRTLRDLKEYIQHWYPESRIARQKFNALARKLRGNANVSRYLRGGAATNSVSNQAWGAAAKMLNKFCEYFINESENENILTKAQQIHEACNNAFITSDNPSLHIGNAVTPLKIVLLKGELNFAGIYKSEKNNIRILLFDAKNKTKLTFGKKIFQNVFKTRKFEYDASFTPFKLSVNVNSRFVIQTKSQLPKHCQTKWGTLEMEPGENFFIGLTEKEKILSQISTDDINSNKYRFVPAAKAATPPGEINDALTKVASK